jgi:hypothetical protein
MRTWETGWGTLRGGDLLDEVWNKFADVGAAQKVFAAITFESCHRGPAATSCVNGSTVRFIFVTNSRALANGEGALVVRCVALCAFIGSVMALSLRFLAILLYTILLPAAVLSFSISNGGVLQRSTDGKPLAAA